MQLKTSIIILSFLLPFKSLFAQVINHNRSLDNMIQQGMDDWKIPGLAAVVVKEGETVFQKGYGVKNLDNRETVDEHTLFNMGSTTKAIICIALGILVDQGKLNWEDKVRTHLPEFRLSDPYITEEARIKDLLTHNLGINGADMLWFIDSLSTEETLKKFSLAEKGYPVRGGYAYNNLMYATAGEVIQAVSGLHWTTFVENHVFEPLGMEKTVARSVDLFKGGNYVTPYIDDNDEGMITANYNLSDQIGAAGMIWSCIADVTNYLKFLTGGGVFKSDTILKSSTFNYLFEPHAFVTRRGFYPTQNLTKPNWRTYGLGWFQHDYRGYKLDFHTGSIAGLIAIAGIVHDKKVAVYVFANLDHAELRHAILYKAIDLYAFDDDSRDWHMEVFDLYMGFRKNALESMQNFEKSRVQDTKPSLELREYEGTYSNDMYGDISVVVVDDHLAISFNDFISISAYHWHYDTFRSDKNNRYKARFMINFNLNDQGGIKELLVFNESFIKL